MKYTQKEIKSYCKKLGYDFYKTFNGDYAIERDDGSHVYMVYRNNDGSYSVYTEYPYGCVDLHEDLAERLGYIAQNAFIDAVKGN